MQNLIKYVLILSSVVMTNSRVYSSELLSLSSSKELSVSSLMRIEDQNIYADSFNLYQNYSVWTPYSSLCQNCDIKFLAKTAELRRPEVQIFLNTIENKKSELLKLYKINGQEYNLLAKMAVGILGVESLFMKHSRYAFKESFPALITFLKDLEAKKAGLAEASPSSRGPTQIKFIPEKISRLYQITPDNLKEPQNAAIATMAYLIEALSTLKRLKSKYNLDHIHFGNLTEYLPYLYFGGGKKLIRKTATPETNIYIKTMKKHIEKIELYEKNFEHKGYL